MIGNQLQTVAKRKSVQSKQEETSFVLSRTVVHVTINKITKTVARLLWLVFVWALSNVFGMIYNGSFHWKVKYCE